MMKEVLLPEISENIDSGDVIKVLVNVGDKITLDQPLIEVETDKAAFEVPSTEEGIIKEINVKEGDKLKVGGTILKVDTSAASNGAYKDSANQQESQSEKKDEVKTEEKDTNKSETVAENVEHEVISNDESNKNGNDNGSINPEKDKTLSELQLIDSLPDETLKDQRNKPLNVLIPASPSVRRLARELGVDISTVKGTGSGGKITEEDVKNYIKDNLNDKKETVEKNEIVTVPAIKSVYKNSQETQIEKMSKVRMITAKTMSQSWNTIPQVTQYDKADITGLDEFRKKYGNAIKEKGGSLTVTSILVKAVSSALQKFPKFNCSIDLEEQTIYYKKFYNIGIAVDTDRGLLVPVIKNADKKTLTDISIELTLLAEKARNKKITPDEMADGTFTISNLGGIGGIGFSPIVYSPQVAILGVSRGSMEPVYSEGQFIPKMMLPLSLSYDHRIIDGADAARFLRYLCESLENPYILFL
ncbi:MAG TPA: branched-chain alpha-keto acid dehydrogenase subunit E2 [Bacteroidetes bacterium]|nr:branched-chain alpha-keto acid dehydrogenase subunit E2 [Bacteroidota bacterium]HCN37741.1 branched-chain alpha-keto acid dehydrogenase subunit E2 [Bacteroidota bacterium]